MGHVVLREARPEDVPVFLRHHQDEEALRMAASTRRDAAAFLAHWAEILGDASVVKRTIEHEGEVAGNVVSWERDGRRLVGYWIGREHWGRGVASAALNAFVREVSVRPLHAQVAKHNVASLRVLEKNGFRLEGEPIVEPDGIEILVLRLA